MSNLLGFQIKISGENYVVSLFPDSLEKNMLQHRILHCWFFLKCILLKCHYKIVS